MTAVLGVVGLVVVPQLATPAAATQPKWSPVGYAAGFQKHPGGLAISGWAYDPSAPHSAIAVYATVGGHTRTTVVANRPRADVARAHPSAGGAHGFTGFVPVPEGTHTVCLWARNVGHGANLKLRCAKRTLDYGPFGVLDRVDTRPGAVHVKGWTVDTDTPAAPVTVVVTLDHRTSQTIAASRRRTDIASRVGPHAGTAHGYETTLRATEGRHTICVTGRDIGYGADNNLGCRTVTLDDRPIGHIDVLQQQSGKVRLRGWTLDRDAPTSSLLMTLRVDRSPARTVVANGTRTDVARVYPSAGSRHGFDLLLAMTEGTHTVCLTARNVGYGSDRSLTCGTVRLNFTPTAALRHLTASSTGLTVQGWATDPDTTKPVNVIVSVDKHVRATSAARLSTTNTKHPGHNFLVSVPSASGTHTVCVVAANAAYGTHNSAPSCKSITLALKPLGHFDSVARPKGASTLVVTGWAFDPDSAAAASVAVTVDKRAAGTFRANVRRDDVARAYRTAGSTRGLSATIPVTDSEHTICLTAKNVGGGADLALGCKIVNALHPVAPTVVRSVKASPGYGAATVSWTAPASDGGAPWSKFVVVASPGGRTVTTSATARSATVTGLASNSVYRFSVRAVNVAGYSTSVYSPSVRTQSGPPPQKTPAPVSTSRYIRNIRTGSAAELSLMRREGAADAHANPGGHRYLSLLDIGGQNGSYGGVVLSATTRFVSYSTLVRCVQAYLDGYHSAQRSGAPVTVAIGTNNDMDVSSGTGRAWAVSVVNPLVSYARKYPGMSIAGANDVEPGFRAGYGAVRNWLSGYLSATSARFIFNGSADGCAWTVANRGCNNGWTMAGLYTLAGGASSSRIVNLPQVYNYTMADQWKYISLTGVGARHPRINFGGPLTEYTACAQAHSCGSLGGRSAWSRMWSNLQSHPALRVSSLPYATDLRIDS